MNTQISNERFPEQKAITFSEIGGSPTPGLILRHVLRGHSAAIYALAWSPDGKTIASAGSRDSSIILWDFQNGTKIKSIVGHGGRVFDLSWSPDGKALAIASENMTIRVWNLLTNSEKALSKAKIHKNWVYAVAWSPNGKTIASGARDAKICLWDADTGKLISSLQEHHGEVRALAWSPDGRTLVSVGDDHKIILWDIEHKSALRILNGETQITNPAFRSDHIGIKDIAWLRDGFNVATVDGYNLVQMWDTQRGMLKKRLEGHTNAVLSVSISSDGRLLASKSLDGYVYIWSLDRGEIVATLYEPVPGEHSSDLSFHPTLPILATLGTKSQVIRIWEIDTDKLEGNKPIESVHYTTAKLVLVGDSGVGKTGLGWRLSHGEFKEHASTHGQQFWTIPDLGVKRADGTECEAVLWDLAGQHIYRQVHSIFLENVTTALILFDPTNRQEPLKGVQFWLEQLKVKGQLPPAVLVGARVDRGAPSLSQQELEHFCKRYEIQGSYVSTSAMSGEGLETLLKKLKVQIPWNEMTATVTTVTFKRIKDYVLALKERPDRKGVLVSPVEMREQLQTTDRQWIFTDAEMMTAVGHLETHGYVVILNSSAGEQYILLTPELLVTLASSVVLLADKNPRELGAISETELLQGRYVFEELKGLSLAETQILLDATVLRFLGHNICFRESLGAETLLIFPALIKQKRPLVDDISSTDDFSYVVRGKVENLYASLVVLLGYTSSFTRINQWQNQAQYEMGEGEICGFRLIEDREGEIELIIYYADQMPSIGRDKFQELFEQFLYQRDVQVTSFPPVTCANGHQQKRSTVIERMREHKPFLFCDECGDKITLPDYTRSQTIGIGASPWLQREEAMARLRSEYEVYMTKVKGYRRGWAAPRCFISYLREQFAWVDKLVSDLREAGVHVVEQADKVLSNDYVIVLDTPAYQKAFTTVALAADAPLIRTRLNKGQQLISLALNGQTGPHSFKDCTLGTFHDETHYPVSLFDLLLNLYAIPLAHAGFYPLRKALHEQWEKISSNSRKFDMKLALRIFISYSHKDELFKDELVTMLAGFRRSGIVDTWQDRDIEAGDEWYQSIQDAMNDCDLAILLVSPDYLASRFIQEEEQPRLLQRRQEMQTRVIPIIIRPCTWQSEPVLKDLQVLPKDGKPVITFPKDTGARDQVWVDVAAVVEKRADQKATS